jgi:hypothetical protein
MRLRTDSAGAKWDCYEHETVLINLHFVMTGRLWLLRLQWPHLVCVPCPRYFRCIDGFLMPRYFVHSVLLAFFNRVFNCDSLSIGNHEGSLVGHRSGCCRATSPCRIGRSHPGPQGCTEPPCYRMAGGALRAAPGRPIAIRTASSIHV